MNRLLILFLLIGFQSFAQKSGFVELKLDSTTIFIRDTNQYSTSFYEQMKDWKLAKTYYLCNDTLKINRVEDSFFDTGLILNQAYKFSGKNASMQIEVVIKRLNLSSISYVAKITKDGQSLDFKGVVHGGVSIYGIDQDTEPGTNLPYSYVEYFSNWNYPLFTLRMDSDKHKKMKIGISGNSSLHFEVQNCPTLYLVYE